MMLLLLLLMMMMMMRMSVPNSAGDRTSTKATLQQYNSVKVKLIVSCSTTLVSYVNIDFIINSNLNTGAQPRLRSWGPIPWSRVLLPFYRKKLDRSTQFGAVGYIITLYSSKSYVKKLGDPSKFGGSGPPDPQW